MKLIGVEPRIQAAKQALNRLHWEIQEAVEPVTGATSMELAEVLAIAAQIGALLDSRLPADSPQRVQLERGLEFMKGLHENPR